MADLPEADAQDVAETFDEDNTNVDGRRGGGREDVEQFEDLPDVLDVTHVAGDDDDDDAEIGEEMDDDEIVSAARDKEDADFEDDDLAGRDEESLRAENVRQSSNVATDPDLADDIYRQDPDEVELTYAGDLMDVAGASSGAADMESDALSDEDLRELHYKD